MKFNGNMISIQFNDWNYIKKVRWCISRQRVISECLYNWYYTKIRDVEEFCIILCKWKIKLIIILLIIFFFTYWLGKYIAGVHNRILEAFSPNVRNTQVHPIGSVQNASTVQSKSLSDNYVRQKMTFSYRSSFILIIQMNN